MPWRKKEKETEKRKKKVWVAVMGDCGAPAQTPPRTGSSRSSRHPAGLRTLILLAQKVIRVRCFYAGDTSVRGDFWAKSSVEIRVFASPTRYMLTSSGFPLLN